VRLVLAREQHPAARLSVSPASARPFNNEPVLLVAALVQVLAAPVVGGPVDPAAPGVPVDPVVGVPVRVAVGVAPEAERQARLVVVGAKTSPVSRSGPSVKSLKCGRPRV
jgi:hypothetical protein